MHSSGVLSYPILEGSKGSEVRVARLGCQLEARFWIWPKHKLRKREAAARGGKQ